MVESREAAMQQQVREAHRLGDEGKPSTRLSELRQREHIGQRQQMRGKLLVTPEGKSIGVIVAMLVGGDGRRLSALRLDDGRRIPADEVAIDGELVVFHGDYESALHWREQREIKLREARQAACVAELQRASLSGLSLTKEPLTAWLSAFLFAAILCLAFAVAFPGRKPPPGPHDQASMVPFDAMPSGLGPLNQGGG